jgi:hypothetical protein
MYYICNNIKSYLYILMINPSPNTNTNSNTTTAECNHPPTKVILTPEGEYVCNACGVVLTLDQAAERGRYIQPEAKGYIDPRGKTNPWLHGLGSVIPKSYYAKVAIRHDAYGDHDSKFANVLVDLELERFGQELMDAFHAYSKSKGDYPTSAYLAIMNVAVVKYGLRLDSITVINAVNRHFKCKIRPVPTAVVQEVARTAKRLGARRACKVSGYLWR